MNQYLLSIYQPDGNPPPPDVLEEITRDTLAVRDEARAAGARMFTAGLHPASTATVVDPRLKDMPMTDGPYVEGNEHIGGPCSSRPTTSTRRWCGRASSRGRPRSR